MQTLVSRIRQAASPLYRAFAVFRDAVDTTLHAIIDFREMTETNETPADPALWHKWQTSWPVKTIDGERDCYVWRRKSEDGKWEYRQREMTPEEKEERAEL